MKQLQKRSLALLLALCMIVSLLPAVAYAANDTWSVVVSNGSATVTVQVKDGEEFTLPNTLDPSVTTDEGQRLVGWKDSDSSSIYAPGTTITVNQNITLAPQLFGAPAGEYIATFIVDGSICEIMTTVDKKIKAPEGRFMEGYQFWGWVTDWLEAFDAKATITLTDDTKFYGVYDYVTYDVTLSTASSSHATVTGVPGAAKYLDEFTFKVTPDSGYEIEAVTASYWRHSISVMYKGNNEYSFVVPSGDVTVKVLTRPLATYNVRVDNGTASVNKNFTGGTFTLPATLNTSVTIPANSRWIGWKDADTSLVYAPGATVPVNKNYQFVPAFAAVPVEEYVAVFYADGLVQSVLNTKDHNVTAPNGREKEGNSFYYWSCDDPAGTYAAGEIITLTKNAEFYASYRADSYSVALATSVKNVTVTGLPGSGEFGTDYSFTLKAKDGYTVDAVSATYEKDGQTHTIPVVMTAVDHYVLTIPAGNVTVNAAVSKVAEQPTAHDVCKDEAAQSHGTVTINGLVENAVSVLLGGAVEVVVTPDAGYCVTEISYTVRDTAAPTLTSDSYTGTAHADTLDTTHTQTFTMPDYDVVVHVAYAPIDFTVTSSASNASITGCPTAANVGKQVHFTTNADYGYLITEAYVVNELTNEYIPVFTGATNAAKSASYFFTMPAAPVSVHLVTVEDVFDVVYLDANGYCIGGESVSYLSTAHVSSYASYVTAQSGSSFLGWISAETQTPVTVPSTNDDDFVVVRKTYVKAVYGECDYTVTTSFNPAQGDVIVDPAANIHLGDSVKLCVDPADGYRVKSVTVQGADNAAVPVTFLDESADYVQHWGFTMPAQDVTVTVVFEVQASSYFTDVRTGDWFYKAVSFVTDRGYFYGVSENLFAPNKLMDRAMFVTVLGRIAEVNPADYASTPSFDDVKPTDYFAPYVAWASTNGVVFGKSATTFDPHAPVTRQEMTALMYRYCDFMGYTLKAENEAWLDSYEDLDLCADWARPSVEWAIGVGLIHGTTPTTIAPRSNATRAAVAQVIMNLMDKVLCQ